MDAFELTRSPKGCKQYLKHATVVKLQRFLWKGRILVELIHKRSLFNGGVENWLSVFSIGDVK